jgi:hypothetical protein
MALCCREERRTGLDAHTTPDTVGPGSYLAVAGKPPVHGFAPFNSTQNRSSVGQTAAKAATPGPGSYEDEAAAPRLPTQGAASAFASRVNRGVPGKAHMVPGPGQYQLRDEWRQRVGLSAPGGAVARVVPNQPHAPSIPAPDQSYGYEETGTGDLVMQRPPAGGYSGVSGKLSVGPGEYETAGWRTTKSHAPSASFGNSRVQRHVFATGADLPGPGSYGGRGAVSLAAQAKGSSNFQSRVPRGHQVAADPDKVGPGPGSYNSATGMESRSMAQTVQSFGSTQKRLASDALLPSERARLAQPGPGAYELRAPVPNQGPQAASDAQIAASAFSSSATRFKPMLKVQEPGPGAYDELDQHTFVADLQRKTHGRHGVFGSTTRRFHTLKRDPVPGAGAYDPAPPVAQREEALGSSFASNVERFTNSAPAGGAEGGGGKPHKQPHATPPPWQYALKSSNAWDKRPGASRKSNQHFGTTTERFTMSKAAARPSPGPGQYAPREGNARQQRSTCECFGSKEPRQKPGVGGTPGPGSYEASIAATDPLVRRSFNITLG